MTDKRPKIVLNTLFIKRIFGLPGKISRAGKDDFFRSLRRFTALALAGVGVAWYALPPPLAHAQAPPLTSAQAPAGAPSTPASAPPQTAQPIAAGASALSQSVAIQQQVDALSRDLVRNSVGVTADIRRGIDRLSRDCPEAAPDQQPAPEQMARIDRSRQLGRVAIEAAASGLPALRRDADAARARVCGVWSFFAKSDNCRAAESLIDHLDRLGALTDQYRDAFDNRHALFAEVARLESRSCVRPGFTDKLLQADEFALQPQEQGFNEQLERALGASRDLLRSLPGGGASGGGR